MSEGTYGGAQPYQGADGLWYAQDASGNQYLWSGSGWVGASSPEATQVAADHLAGLLQLQADLAAESPVVPPAASAPTGSLQESQDAMMESVIASGDPVAIQMGMDSVEANAANARIWLETPGIDSDMDDVDDPYDVQPLDADVQDLGDPDAGLF